MGHDPAPAHAPHPRDRTWLHNAAVYDLRMNKKKQNKKQLIIQQINNKIKYIKIHKNNNNT